MNVAVTGMGALSILGKGVAEHRANLFQNNPPPYAPHAEQLNAAAPRLDMIPISPEIRHYSEILGITLSRNSTLALAAFEEAYKKSGWSLRELKNKKVAFIMGTTAGCSITDAAYFQSYALNEAPDPEGYKNAIKQSPALVLKKLSGLENADIYLINNACTSSTDALGLGAKLLEQNKYDVVFAGGSDEIVFHSYCGFSSLQLVSPKFRCSPFDKKRDGLLLTEAAAVLCLERNDDAQKRKQPALGYIIGYESVTESYHQTGPHPEAEGLQCITADILKKSNLKNEDLSFINAHATGTSSNDFSEGKFFARFMPNIPILATKGYTGHCLGAVGALEAIFCFLCFDEKKLPVSYGFTEVDPEVGIIPTLKTTPLDSNKTPHAYSTSVGFGGVNSGILLKGISK